MTMSANSSHSILAHTDSLAATWSDFLLLVGRVTLGWLFLASGYGKLGGIPGTTAYFTSLGLCLRSFGLGLQALPKLFLAWP